MEIKLNRNISRFIFPIFSLLLFVSLAPFYRITCFRNTARDRKINLQQRLPFCNKRDIVLVLHFRGFIYLARKQISKNLHGLDVFENYRPAKIQLLEKIYALRAKITRIINKRDMNLNIMFHVLIHVYISTFEAFYLTAHISAVALCYRLYSFKPCSLFLLQQNV